MRRRVIAVLLCCALLTGLTGCGSFYTRSYSSILPHQEQSASDEDASILRAENYTDLVSCVQHFVSMGQSSGTIHLYQYTGDVEKDLEAACDEVLTQDPLGAYMLSRIDHSYSHIVSYYECTLSFTYRRTMQDMAAIVSAYGTGTIRDQIGAALSSFQPGLVLRTSEYYADRSELLALAREAYYSAPSTAMGYPGISITLYPNSGNTRIIEFSFTYDRSQASLLERAEAVAAAAAQLVGQDAAADSNVAWLLYSRLVSQVSFDPDGNSNVYDALCRGSADSEGIALAYELLCQLAGIPCQLIQGTLNGEPHSWNLVTLGEVSWQLDLTRNDPEEHFLHNDATMADAHYSWSTEDYPACEGEEEPLPTTDVVVTEPAPEDGAPQDAETPQESGTEGDAPPVSEEDSQP